MKNKGRRGGGSSLLLRCGLESAETEMCGGHVQGAVTRSGMTSIVRRRYEPHGGNKRRSPLVKPPVPLRFRTFEPALQ